VKLFSVRFVFWKSGATLSDVMAVFRMSTHTQTCSEVTDCDQELMLLLINRFLNNLASRTFEYA
jgi:hypothetical protein